MIAGFEYQHYKGGTYEFLGIASPYNDAAITKFKMGKPYQVFDALSPDESNLLRINVWEKNGVMICDCDTPQVIYRAYVDWEDERGREYGDTWGRSVNDYFSTVAVLKNDLLTTRKRFALCFDKDLVHPKKKELVGV